MNKALLDTDIYSKILKAVDSKVVQNTSAYRKIHRQLTVSAVTAMEIVQGLQRVGASDRRLERFRDALAREETLVFDGKTADLAGQISGDLIRTGQQIGRFDPMIAAVAVINGLDLVTGNTAHYQRIQPLGYSLKLTNWRF